ncbi:hypothetical protein [Myxosarcina sp. GI1]|uniref:hypothetical protein n=1 Tax=Myxosarcina sp. GI1 TaxID=1541065 RepID=UPI00155AD976|nr:hypothetical protein [Myxosarcina sp. GI1]
MKRKVTPDLQEVKMSKKGKTTLSSIALEWLIKDYQQHPSMRQVEILKDKLKREKQEDKLVYQSVKTNLATC